MDASEKGRRYAQIFRKAGVSLGKGEIARALAAFKEGQALAERLGDRTMAQRFAREIERTGKSSGCGQ